MDELVRLFQETKMDEHEFACLKAIVFFDPSKSIPPSWLMKKNVTIFAGLHFNL